MLTIPPLKDQASIAGVASMLDNKDSDVLQSALVNAVQIAKDQPCNLLGELGQAHGMVDIILSLTVDVTEVGFPSPSNALLLIILSCRFICLRNSHYQLSQWPLA
jgi:hypothetical protein